MVTDAALAALNGVSADNFGTTTVDLPGDNKPVVRDMQYSVGDGVGYTPIPVEDNNPAGNAWQWRPLHDHLKQYLPRLLPTQAPINWIRCSRFVQHTGTESTFRALHPQASLKS